MLFTSTTIDFDELVPRIFRRARQIDLTLSQVSYEKAP